MKKTLLEQAESDLEGILKFASDERGMYTNYLKQIAKMFLVPLAAAGAAGASSYYFGKKDRDRHQTDLMNSMKSVATKDPAFATDPAKFMERFNELTVISPTVAKNPSIASKVISANFDNGFDVDSIHKLTAIEHNTSTSRGGIHPAAAARAGAGNALKTLVQTFGPDMLHSYKHQTNNLQTGLKNIAKKKEDQMEADLNAMADAFMKQQKDKGFDKESSAQRVSDECLGQMLAERYCMIKTAGVGDLLTSGASHMGKGLAFFAPAMALAGGVELIRQTLESRRTSELEAQADKNFKELMRTSDIAKGNSVDAHEAFNTLKAVAPSLAARPLVARTFIDYVASQGRLAPETVQQLAEAEDRVRGLGASKTNFFGDLKTTMGLMEPVAKGKGFGHSSPRKPKKGIF